MTTDRPSRAGTPRAVTPGRRRNHVARGARWFTAGLAVSGTVGLAGYLDATEPVTVPTSLTRQSADRRQVAAMPALPPTPQVAIAPAPEVTQPVPVVTAPPRTIRVRSHATTRGSDG